MEVDLPDETGGLQHGEDVADEPERNAREAREVVDVEAV